MQEHLSGAIIRLIERYCALTSYMRALYGTHMNPTAPSANHIILAVLESEQRNVSSRAVSEIAGVSQRAASDIMRFLEFHGGLSPGREIRWRRTASILSMLRLAAMNPVRTLTAPLDGSSAQQALESSGIQSALGFTSAANQWAFFEPHRNHQLFVERGSAVKATSALKQGSPARGKGETITLFETDLDSLGTTSLQSQTLTTRLQTWIDLTHFPRAGAHEAFFRKVIRNEYPQAEGL